VVASADGLGQQSVGAPLRVTYLPSHVYTANLLPDSDVNWLPVNVSK
jgi:hypothetical protein